LKVEVRELTNQDIFTVAKMLLKTVQSGNKEIAEIYKKHKEEQQKMINEKQEKGEKITEEDMVSEGIQVAMEIFYILLEHSEKELMKWLADLCDMNYTEFRDAPVYTMPQVIEQLAEQENLKSFFQSAYSLYKKMKG